MQILLKTYINVFGIALLILFLFIRQPNSKWDKIISGDGKSYYAYLPAAFIYHDLNYGFVEEYEAKYYPPDKSLFKEFRIEFEGAIVNKTFPGVSLLWLPFFLIAHWLSSIFGFEVDGYSILYQYAIGMAAIFYCWLGLKWLSNFLMRFKIKPIIIGLVATAILFGTNLFYYTIHDPSLTHVYNFALIAGFLNYFRLSVLERKLSHYIWMLILLGLIIITRPINLLILLAIPFTVNSWEQLGNYLKSILSSPKMWLIAFIIMILFAAYPIGWWLAQSGHMIVYSYGEEGFDFSQPHILKILFSYEKGWLVYTPLAMLSLLGIFHYLKTKRTLGIYMVLFFLLLAYIFSSWWIWTYGGSFGQRVFIDYYALIGLLIAIGIQQIHKRTVILLLTIVVGLGIGLNQVQTYQHRYGIVPTYGMTQSIYWSNFLKISKTSKSNQDLKPHKILKEFYTGFEDNAAWLTLSRKDNSPTYKGAFSQKINATVPFSDGYFGPTIKESDFVNVEAKLFSKNHNPGTKLVLDLSQNGNSIIYEAILLDDFIHKNHWVDVAHTFNLPNGIIGDLKIYFWQPKEGEACIDELKIKFGIYQ